MLKMKMHTEPINIPLPRQDCASGKTHVFAEFPNGWGCLNCSAFVLNSSGVVMTEKHPARPIPILTQPSAAKTEEDILFDIINELLPIARSDISLQELRRVAIRLITPQGD